MFVVFFVCVCVCMRFYTKVIVIAVRFVCQVERFIAQLFFGFVCVVVAVVISFH